MIARSTTTRATLTVIAVGNIQDEGPTWDRVTEGSADTHYIIIIRLYFPIQNTKYNKKQNSVLT